MIELYPPTYEDDCVMDALIPFDGDSGPSQRVSVMATISENKLHATCGACALRFDLDTEEITTTVPCLFK